MTVGPTKPPMLPTELIRAIPPAAAVPLRNPVGMLQKGPSVLQIPVALTHRARKASTGCRWTARRSRGPPPRRMPATPRGGGGPRCDPSGAPRAPCRSRRRRMGARRSARSRVLLEPGEALHDLRQPERDAVEADDGREVQQAEPPHRPVRERLPQGETLRPLHRRFAFRLERCLEPLLLRGAEPAGLRARGRGGKQSVVTPSTTAGSPSTRNNHCHPARPPIPPSVRSAAEMGPPITPASAVDVRNSANTRARSRAGIQCVR